MPDGNLPGDQGKTPGTVQSRPDLYFISPAAKRLMGIRMETNGGAAPAALQDGGAGDQGGNGGGAQSKGSGGGFDWNLFPDVPEEQRPLLEPHLKQTQGHVTQLEQAFAPWKGFAEGNIEPDYVQGLIAFDQAFNQDPVSVFLKLAEDLQKSGQLTDDLDLNTLRAIVEGQEVGGEEPAGEEGGEQEGEEPAWVRELRQQNEELRQRLDGRDQREAQTQQQQQLDEALEGMRNQLKEAGYTDDTLPDEGTLTGLIIAHRGDVDKALASITGLRDNVLTAFANGKTRSGSEEGEGKGPTMPKGSPRAPKAKGRGPRSEFAEARAGAEQMLERNLEHQAQE